MATIVTFTTDFGFADGYVGAMKGIVLAAVPDARLVDISHGISPQDVAGGAVALAQAAPYYPPGTIHVAVVDPGVGSGRADLVVESGRQLFVGPDNGLLSLAAPPPRRAFRIESPRFRREPVSPTFHGRDVFAPAAGRLAAGAQPASAGSEAESIVELSLPISRQIDGRVEGSVVYVDAFGNLVTSIRAEELSPGQVVELDGRGLKWRPAVGRTFMDVGPGELVAYAGSTGMLEIAVRNGSAAAATGALRGSGVRLKGTS